MNNLKFPRLAKADPKTDPLPEGATPHKVWLVVRNQAIADLRSASPRKWTLGRLALAFDLDPSSVSLILKAAGRRPGARRVAS